jgi:hypothetical protein
MLENYLCTAKPGLLFIFAFLQKKRQKIRICGVKNEQFQKNSLPQDSGSKINM